MNVSKTWLVTKESSKSHAVSLFTNTSVNITSHSKSYLGAPLGSFFVKKFVHGRVATWKTELQSLCELACTQPHATFAVYTHGLSNKWTRTIANDGHLFTELEEVIQSNLLLALTGRPPLNFTERDLLSLPPKHGGIGLVNPTTCDHNYVTFWEASCARDTVKDLQLHSRSHVSSEPDQARTEMN